MTLPKRVGDLTTPVSANSYMLATCGDGVRIVALFTQNWPGTEGTMTTPLADVVFSATIAKELYAELGRNLRRHEQMFGPIPSRQYIDEAWAEVTAPDLDAHGCEKRLPEPGA